MKAKNEECAVYNITRNNNDDDATIARALEIMATRMRTPGECLNSPQTVKDFFKLKLAEAEAEIFAVIWLDTQHRVIEYQELFTGTLSQTSVYPREVVKAALAVNASACIFAHNHPSGVTNPSRSDELLTAALKAALALIDVRVLDHIIVGAMATMSFAESGRI